MFTECVVSWLLSGSTTIWIYVVHDHPLLLLFPSVQLTHGWPLSGECVAMRAEHHGDFPVGEADCAHPQQYWINQSINHCCITDLHKEGKCTGWRLAVGLCSVVIMLALICSRACQWEKSFWLALQLRIRREREKESPFCKLLSRVKVARLMWKWKHCFITTSVCTSGVLSLQVYHFEWQTETATILFNPQLFSLAGAEHTN